MHLKIAICLKLLKDMVYIQCTTCSKQMLICIHLCRIKQLHLKYLTPRIQRYQTSAWYISNPRPLICKSCTPEPRHTITNLFILKNGIQETFKSSCIVVFLCNFIHVSSHSIYYLLYILFKFQILLQWGTIL